MQINKIDPDKLGYVWMGKPSLLPYFLVSQRMFGMTIVTIGIFWYLKFAWFLPTQIWSVYYAACFLIAIGRWARRTYYITNQSFVVRIGKTNYCIPFSEIKKEEVKTLSNPLEVIFGCRTIQYGRKYGYHSSKGSNTNLWRDQARFWCIRDYKTIEKYCAKALLKSY